MENLRKKANVRSVNNAKDYINYVSKQSFASWKIFNKDLVAIPESKPVLVFNKPVYLGFCILELRKLFMYDYH